jgi:hypothetical protein
MLRLGCSKQGRDACRFDWTTIERCLCPLVAKFSVRLEIVLCLPASRVSRGSYMCGTEYESGAQLIGAIVRLFEMLCRQLQGSKRLIRLLRACDTFDCPPVSIWSRTFELGCCRDWVALMWNFDNGAIRQRSLKQHWHCSHCFRQYRLSAASPQSRAIHGYGQNEDDSSARKRWQQSEAFSKNHARADTFFPVSHALRPWVAHRYGWSEGRQQKLDRNEAQQHPPNGF